MEDVKQNLRYITKKKKNTICKLREMGLSHSVLSFSSFVVN